MECPLCGKEMNKIYINYYTKVTKRREGVENPICIENEKNKEEYNCCNCGVRCIYPDKEWFGIPHPTAKQEKFAKAISKKLKIDLPIPYKKFYSNFISLNIDEFYKIITEESEKQNAEEIAMD